jgi:N-acetylated-alpha-linked acidic dipeptidase
VIAKIDGAVEKDRWVILGNHRDAWTFGAVDPNSGSTAMLEVARGLGQLLKEGWKPRRTIILASWDAEEYGLIGSTEWAEQHAAELKEKAVAYLNMDAAVSGSNFGASSVPSLWRTIRAVTKEIQDPKTGKTVYEAWQERARTSQPENETTESTMREDREARIGSLGSGSDYTPFLQHLGIPCTDMGFGGDYGVYHSAYDSFHWMSSFGDPTFGYHVAAAQTWGTLALRLVEAEGLPFYYTDYANQITEFFKESVVTAKRRNLMSSVNEELMNEALTAFSQEAARIERSRNDAVDALGSGGNANAVARLKRLNDALIGAERALVDERGLRGRSWYKHQIYAPGFYTGYAAQPLTDFRQGLEDRNGPNAKEALDRIIASINRATEVLRKARD